MPVNATSIIIINYKLPPTVLSLGDPKTQLCSPAVQMY